MSEKQESNQNIPPLPPPLNGSLHMAVQLSMAEDILKMEGLIKQTQVKIQDEPIVASEGQDMQKRKNKKRVISNPLQKTGHWDEAEHKTYLSFLMAHKAIMESQDMKKTSKIFKLMSEIIGTRSPSQCRSHHQKFNPFTHHIKKRQKGAGRKRKEEAQYPKQKAEIDENPLPSFMLQTPPFLMPTGYPQVMPNFPWPTDIGQPGQQMHFQEDGNIMPHMIDQMMFLQMFNQPPPPAPPVDELNKSQFYNFSIFHTPVNLSINYLNPYMQQPDLNQPQQFMPYDLINDEQVQQQFGEMAKRGIE